GDKWMPMVPAMQALVLAGLIRSIAATAGPIFYAVGKPEIVTRWQPVRLAVLAALIYPFTAKWGILGTSIAVFLSNLASAIGFSVKVIDITKCTAKGFAKKIILPSISASIMVLLIFVLKSGVKGAGILEFVLLVGVGPLFHCPLPNKVGSGFLRRVGACPQLR
ncbi:unnamed protein product, partial [marine sediment metagenome]